MYDKVRVEDVCQMSDWITEDVCQETGSSNIGLFQMENAKEGLYVASVDKGGRRERESKRQVGEKESNATKSNITIIVAF